MSNGAGGQSLPPPGHPEHIGVAVRPIAERLDLAGAVRPYTRHAWQPDGPYAPTLHIDDVSEIPFLTDIAGVPEYQHRARIRARHGDCYATVTPSDPAYDTYAVEHLRMGRATRLAAHPPSGTSPLAVAAGCLAGETFDRLVVEARRTGRLVIHPYMSIDPVWTLAQRIAQTSGAAVTVTGSPPPVTWIANDKALFDEVVTAILGAGWSPETHGAHTAPAIAANLARLAETWPSVGLKRTRCASAMGNQVFDATVLRGRPPGEVEVLVDRFLRRTEWTPGETVLAVAWEDAASSPSTQWWIPPAGCGAPRLDGIYEQILEGDRKVFVGSRPSTLPDGVNRRLAQASARVAVALQGLGYVGRCSFDHLVVGDPGGDCEIRFTECNGRWGGTSAPMRLVDDIAPQWRDVWAGTRRPYRAQDVMYAGLVGARFGDVLERVGAEAYDPATGKGRFIFYNVGPIPEFGKFDVIALAETVADADQAIEELLPRLLGVQPMVRPLSTSRGTRPAPRIGARLYPAAARRTSES